LTGVAFCDNLCQVTENVRKPDRKRDSLLAHCIARAVIHDQGGLEAATEKYGPKGERLSKWTATMAAAKVTGKASRVSAFIVMWAAAMREEGIDEFSITEYQRYWNESERRAYRLQVEFRELWPEYETPNELARRIVRHLDASMSRREILTLPTRLKVTA
jgi:hypothetical protein